MVFATIGGFRSFVISSHDRKHVGDVCGNLLNFYKFERMGKVNVETIFQ